MRKEHHDGVCSLTLGLLRHKISKELEVAKPTEEYADVCWLLCKWAGVHCTSINLNKNYAVARHRDTNNEGVSVVKAVGNFEGGQLLYWPNDPKNCRADQLHVKDAMQLNPRAQSVLINGSCALEVLNFQGERISAVFFCAKGYKGTGQQALCHFGFKWPSDLSLCKLQIALARRQSTPRCACGFSRACGWRHEEAPSQGPPHAPVGRKLRYSGARSCVAMSGHHAEMP